MQKKDAKAIGSRLMAFLKKNIHYILMILCHTDIDVQITVIYSLYLDGELAFSLHHFTTSEARHAFNHTSEPLFQFNMSSG